MSATAPPRGRGAARALIVVAQLQAILVWAQALLAGLFMSGEGAWRSWHSINGLLLLVLGLAVLVLALIVRARGGPGWPALVGALLLTSLLVQFFSGFAGLVALHIPLGVAIFGFAIGLRINARTLTAIPQPTS